MQETFQLFEFEKKKRGLLRFGRQKYDLVLLQTICLALIARGQQGKVLINRFQLRSVLILNITTFCSNILHFFQLYKTIRV